MSRQQILTKESDIFTLPAPRGDATERLYMDRGPKRARGLGLRVRVDGSRTWMFFYRFGGAQRRIQIGAASTTGWTLAKARAKATTYRADVDNQIDPKAARDAKDEAGRLASDAKTFAELKDAYIEARRPHMKPRSLEETIRHLEKHWAPFHKKPAHAITSDMIADRLKDIQKASGPVARNRARSTLSAMFAWAIVERFDKQIKGNPVDSTGKAKENGPRERVLTNAELAAIWLACPESDYGRIVRLLMLTAQRREEIGGLLVDEIDTEGLLIALPSERTKNHRPHDVPLSESAKAVINSIVLREGRDHVFGDGEGGFSGWSDAKEAMDDACGVKDWTLHDLRRTAATRMADLGVQPHVIEAVLNHVSGHKAGVAGIYNRSTYAVEKRAALDIWANHLRVAIAKSEGSNVTRLRRREA